MIDLDIPPHGSDRKDWDLRINHILNCIGMGRH